MTIRRLSVSLSPELESMIRAAAQDAHVPVSTWLAKAAEEKAAAQEIQASGLAGIAAYEAENGHISRAGRTRAREVLIEAGVIEGPITGNPPQQLAA